MSRDGIPIATEWTLRSPHQDGLGRLGTRAATLGVLLAGVAAASVLTPLVAYSLNAAVWTTAVLALAAMLVISLVRIEWGFLILVASLAVQTPIFYPRGWAFGATDNLRFYHFLAVPFVLAWLAHRAMGLGRSYRTGLVEWALVVLCVWATVSMLWAPATPHALLTLGRTILAVTLLYATVTLVRDRPMLYKTITVWLAAAAVAAVSGLIIWVGDQFFEAIPGKGVSIQTRYFEIFYTFLINHKPAGLLASERLAYFCYLSAPLAFWLAVRSKRKWPWILLVFFYLLVQRLPFKRAGMLGILAGFSTLMLLAPFLRRRFVRNIALVWALVLGAFTVPGVLVGNLGTYRVATAFQTSGRLTWQTRLENYAVVLKAMDKQYGMTTLGVGGARHFQFLPSHEHSIHLAVFFDFGVVGTAIYLVFVVGLAVRLLVATTSRDLPDADVALLGGFLAGLIALGADGVVNHGYCYGDLSVYAGLALAAWDLTYRRLKGPRPRASADVGDGSRRGMGRES